jgi:hypothetical protein
MGTVWTPACDLIDGFDPHLDEREKWADFERAVDEAGAKVLRRARFVRLGTRERMILGDVLARSLASTGDTVRWLSRPASMAQAKAESRALKTLEQRGLLTRLASDGEPGLPTEFVRLTRAGVEAAKRFTPVLEEAA